MIELIPAIDIIDGQCVRLTKGDYDQKTVYRDSPAEVAKEFEALDHDLFLLSLQRIHDGMTVRVVLCFRLAERLAEFLLCSGERILYGSSIAQQQYFFNCTHIAILW